VAVDGDFSAAVASAEGVWSEFRARRETGVAQVPPTVKRGSIGRRGEGASERAAGAVL
jgi:hypothetical protein